ncbi:MAG: SDR family oxidoreductase [Rhodobacteraceae bacterium]|nr:SDR family oxidoreductase [Paracoccaceae bacterium]
MQTVLITGCSSGFGLETAKLLLDRGWTVIATMRNPDASLLPRSDNLRILPLDVTDGASIAAAVDAAGAIDALVNNAGIGWLNALEGTSLETVRQIFETNTFGPIAMMQAVLPGMRARGTGVIVNVTSSVTLMPLPLLSVYTASKAAINALTGSVAHELKDLGIRTHVVLPGRAPGTSFSASAQAALSERGGFPEAYTGFAKATFARMQAASASAMITSPGDVSEAIWNAVTDPDAPARIPAGADAVEWFTG